MAVFSTTQDALDWQPDSTAYPAPPISIVGTAPGNHWENPPPSESYEGAGGVHMMGNIFGITGAICISMTFIIGTSVPFASELRYYVRLQFNRLGQ